MSITCIVLYNEDGLHRQRLLFNTNSICIVIKYAQLDIFLKYREMLFIFQILFDDERVHFCPI